MVTFVGVLVFLQLLYVQTQGEMETLEDFGPNISCINIFHSSATYMFVVINKFPFCRLDFAVYTDSISH
jgi:hypothetical protein